VTVALESVFDADAALAPAFAAADSRVPAADSARVAPGKGDRVVESAAFLPALPLSPQANANAANPRPTIDRGECMMEGTMQSRHQAPPVDHGKTESKKAAECECALRGFFDVELYRCVRSSQDPDASRAVM
jgi:hypothetical protein